MFVFLILCDKICTALICEAIAFTLLALTNFAHQHTLYIYIYTCTNSHIIYKIIFEKKFEKEKLMKVLENNGDANATARKSLTK